MSVQEVWCSESACQCNGLECLPDALNSGQPLSTHQVDGITSLVHKALNSVPRYQRRNLEDEDLCQDASLAVLMAARNHGSSPIQNFPGYAFVTAKNAMLSSARRADPLAVSQRRDLDRIEAIKETLQAQGIFPTAEEIAEMVGLDVKRVISLENLAMTTHIASLDESELDKEPVDSIELIPENIVLFNEDQKRLHEAINALPLRDRGILMMYWVHQKSVSFIAEHYSISTPRVYQLLERAAKTVRLALVAA